MRCFLRDYIEIGHRGCVIAEHVEGHHRQYPLGALLTELLLDEVTSALDVTVQASVVKMLASVQSATGMSMVIVSHDIALIASFADRLIVLRNGQVVEQGSVGDVIDSPSDPDTQHLVKLAKTNSV